MEIEKSGPITVLIQVLNHFFYWFVSYIWEQSLYIARVGGGGGVGVGEFLKRDHIVFREN